MASVCWTGPLSSQGWGLALWERWAAAGPGVRVRVRALCECARMPCACTVRERVCSASGLQRLRREH